MQIYKNPNCKKVRGSHILEVTCAYCKCFIKILSEEENR